MKVQFKVHNPHRLPIQRDVKLETGEAASAEVAGFEAELMAQDGISGTFKFRAVGKERVEAALALMVEDSILEADLVPVKKA